jgi:putative holliday junction resolvase
MLVISALGLDLGKKRIGVAGCDRSGLIATGLTTIHRRSFPEDIQQLQQICQQRQVEQLIAGMPYSMDGSIGYQARQTQKLGQRIAIALNLPLEYVDERLTSYQAVELLREEKRDRHQYKDLIDRKAAALILQQWLDQRRSQLSPPDQGGSPSTSAHTFLLESIAEVD